MILPYDNPLDHLVLARMTIDKDEIATMKSGRYHLDRRNLLICTLISLFAIQTVNMNVTTIIPHYVKNNHKSLSEIHCALIMT